MKSTVVTRLIIRLLLLTLFVGAGFIAIDRQAEPASADYTTCFFASTDQDCDGVSDTADPEPQNPCAPNTGAPACTHPDGPVDDDADGRFAFPYGGSSQDPDDGDACNPDPNHGNCVTGTDDDGDGFNADVDCDDSNPEVYPGAPELRDGLDNDCDGELTRGDRWVNRIAEFKRFIERLNSWWNDRND